MSPISQIRRLRWLPRAVLTLVVAATLQATLLPCAMAATSEMANHCVYCPSAHDGGAQGANDCAFLHAADAYATSSAPSLLMDTPPLAPAALHVDEGWRNDQDWTASPLPTPPPRRPLHLTHCVQLK